MGVVSVKKGFHPLECTRIERTKNPFRTVFICHHNVLCIVIFQFYHPAVGTQDGFYCQRGVTTIQTNYPVVLLAFLFLRYHCGQYSG